MSNGMCSRRHKKIFQSLLLFTVSLGLIYGGMVSYEMHKQMKKTEAMALKYQQHQESLSAQLQVVYEHRSRLEKSLQKERLEHKKAKEGQYYLMHKLEAQQILNKEKQDFSNKFNSLHVQHQMLKSQHEELKKQMYDLQEQHQIQVEDHSKVIDEHRQKYDQLRQTKEREISKLEENVYNLQEENKQLRKAHQEVHTQLQDARQRHKDLKSAHDRLALTLEDHKSALAVAQGQIVEFKQLKETLNRMSSLRQVDEKPAQAPAQAAALRADSSHNQPDHKEAQSRVEEGEGHRKDVGEGKQQLAVPQRVVQPEGEAGAGAGEEEGKERGGAREEQQRKEEAEEEMEQAGQPQHPEEPGQPREEEEEEKEPEQNQPDENVLDHNGHQAAPPPARELQPGAQPDMEQQAAAQAEPVKSAYEQQQQVQQREWQLERQRAAAQLAEESRQAHLREQLLRQGNQFDNMDSAVVQGEEDPPNKQEEEGNIQTQLEEEEGEQAEGDHGRNREDNLAEEDVNPEDDPNNQGEDEFEEAQEQGAGAPAGQSQHQAGENQNQPAAAERDERGMAGNPDQQEDPLDEQYQEEGEEEVQDLRLHQRQEEEVVKEAEAPYNDDNREYSLMRQDHMKRQEGPEKEDNAARKEGAATEEGNYEEEEAEVLEDEEGAQDKLARAEI
ncbi:hypothetical protein MATL_G00119410 [Megalops atlanticus]|uniref:Golgi integral membrane protein 4 n=1 Tax=Megalops atlanticus TaxID=7932 RepID=A0A9D3PYD3_MEGAT|nr:hypothetical protein MATL_G00119410 [Megalops atlanticus]